MAGWQAKAIQQERTALKRGFMKKESALRHRMQDAIQLFGRAASKTRNQPGRDYFIEEIMKSHHAAGLLRAGEQIIGAGAFGVGKGFSSSAYCRRIITTERKGSQYFLIIGRPRVKTSGA